MRQPAREKGSRRTEKKLFGATCGSLPGPRREDQTHETKTIGATCGSLFTFRGKGDAMAMEGNREDLRWYVVRTHANQEDRAAGNIGSLNVETFSPRYRKVIYNPYNGKPTYLNRALFPRYIFARFDLEKHLHRIQYSRGVANILCFSGAPAEVEGEMVKLMKARVGNGGFVRLGDEFMPGDEVLISDGPFRNFRGIFEHELGDEDRVRILLDSVGYQAHIVIEKHLVRKASAEMPVPARL
jgi:transcriptional antiterminator RfaH